MRLRTSFMDGREIAAPRRLTARPERPARRRSPWPLRVMPARASGLLGTMSPNRLGVRLKRFPGRPGVKVVAPPVCVDEPLNPLRVANIGLGLPMKVGTTVDMQNRLEAIARRNIFIGDATNVMP